MPGGIFRGGEPSKRRRLPPQMLPKREFADLLPSRPELALRMLGSMSQHLRVIVGLLDDFALKDTETRVANWLLKRCPRPLRDGPAVLELDRTTRARGGIGHDQRNPFPHPGEVSRSKAAPGRRPENYHHAAATTGPITPAASRRVLKFITTRDHGEFARAPRPPRECRCQVHFL